MKKYLFVSDIHGKDQNLEERLIKIATSPNVPKIVFFLGDIVGTPLLDQLQKLFYNKVYNHIKELLASNPHPTDEEILNFPIENGETLADGIAKLWDFLHDLFPDLDPINRVEYILELSKYTHYGHFVSNLPEEIRQILQADMEKNAKSIVDIMTKFTDKGSMVVIVEGNWDARTPLDFYPTVECKALPIEKRSFYFKNYLESLNNKVFYFDQVGTIETENEIFVLWPFDSAVEATMVPEFEDEETRKIVLVSHAQIDWKAIKENTPMTGEGRKIQENMGMTFHDLHADTAVHGHLHDNGNDYFFNEKLIHYLPKGTERFIDF